MRCIFCKQNSDNSKSIEHIIPESLGNKEHVLPKGVVCDMCNNYLALKVEKKLLEQDYFKAIRSRNNIKNKKDKIVSWKGTIIANNKIFTVDFILENGHIGLDSTNKELESYILSGHANKMYVQIFQTPEENNIYLSKFICKVGIEALTKLCLDVSNYENEVVDKKELDPIRNFVRYGKSTAIWEYSQRRIYSELDIFLETPGHPYEILHEYTFKYSESMELFFIVSIMGIEYAINMAGPSIETYNLLLEKNNYKSFLSVDTEINLTKLNNLY